MCQKGTSKTFSNFKIKIDLSKFVTVPSEYVHHIHRTRCRRHGKCTQDNKFYYSNSLHIRTYQIKNIDAVFPKLCTLQ